MTLWIHEPPNFSSHDVVLSPDLLAVFGPFSQKDLLGVKLPPGVQRRDPTDLGGADPLHGNREAKARRKLRKSVATSRTFVFKPIQAATEADPGATRSNQLQISLSKTVASIYGFSNRQEVVLSKEPISDSIVSHVELYFRDQYIGRADMWRLVILLEDTCVYLGQKVVLAGCVRATIGRLFIKERKVTSGYVSPETKTIFRSESAKYHLLLQLGREMWDFDEDGEVYFEKALTGFLPELLKRWRAVPTNHVLSITLFARVWYEQSELHMLDEAGLPVRRESGDSGRHYIDYYKVIVDLESQSDWNEVISMLKEEVFRFQHDILLVNRPEAGPSGAPWQEEQHADLLRRDRAVLAGRLSTSHEGNILEAVNLSLNPLDEHYIDRDLNRTGLDIVILTAGTGHFRVDKGWLRLTTERMIDNGIGLDMVCLTKMPLHSVPLFYFTSEIPDRASESRLLGRASSGSGRKCENNPTTPGILNPSGASGPPDPLYFDSQRSGLVKAAGRNGSGSNTVAYVPTMGFYSIPHWIDASFYNLQQDQPFRVDRFLPRVKMREIQQIGYMENEISDTSLPYLDLRRVPGVRGGTVLSSLGYPRSAGDVYGSRDDGKRSAGSQGRQSYMNSEAFASREQRRALRERFDRETFRDFEFAPINVRSGAVLASGSAAGSTGWGLLNTTPDAFRTGVGNASSFAESLVPKSMSSRPNRVGRDSLRGKPALESHAEDEGWHDDREDDVQIQQQYDGPPKASRERERLLSLFDGPAYTDELQSLSTSTRMHNILTLSASGEFSRVNSRPTSIRSAATFGRTLRPLQPAGKADAFVAPAQAQDLLADLPHSSESSRDLNGFSSTASPAPAGEAAFRLFGQRPSPSKPQPRRLASTKPTGSRYKLVSRWISSSFYASGSTDVTQHSSLMPNFSQKSSVILSLTHSPESVASAASLRMKALLVKATGQTRRGEDRHCSNLRSPESRQPRMQSSQDPVASSTDDNAKTDVNLSGRNDLPDADMQVDSPSPITIPLLHHLRADSAVGCSSTAVDVSDELAAAEVKFQQEQWAYEQALEDQEARAQYTQRAQVEKQTLVNPLNPRKSLRTNPTLGQHLRWQHLFPRRLNRHVVKWRSITTPACLPLTTFYLPTRQELMDHWAEYPHTLSISADLNSMLVKRSPSTAPAMAALREMTSQRLAQGFQFIVPVESSSEDVKDIEDRDGAGCGAVSSRKYATHPGFGHGAFSLRNPTELFQPGILASGNPILLGMSNQIHRLSYDRAASAINVERYIRKISYNTFPIEYSCCVWPRHLPGYQTVRATFRYPNLTTYDWTLLDSLVTGHAEVESFTEGLRYWRTRIVIVPTEGRPPPMIAPTGEQLDDEEIRLIGMDRLADTFARARWKGRSSRGCHGPAATPLLRFIPTSLDPSMSMHDEEFMRQMEAAIAEDDQAEEAAHQRRAASRSKRQIKDAPLDSIAIAMAHDRYGVKIEDRFWNRRIYKSAFTGTDLTTWLLKEHVDVHDREEAAEWGKTLMKKGLFEHTTSSHGFLDGHYFYHLKGEYAKKAASVVTRRPSKEESHPSGLNKLSSGHAAQRSASNGSDNERKQPNAGKGTHGRSRCMKMSRSLIIDIDPGRKSDRAETAILHYDISHNPANGFNAQLHWLGTTARFIEDTVQNWTRAMERYGLRLIEAPIGQICDVGKQNPFQAAVLIHLSLPPPATSSYGHLLPPHVNPGEYFEWALLRRFGFVLDQEAANRYPNDVEIIYQSRPSRFDYSQFVHRSGVAFVQVVGGRQGFLWLNNRLFNSPVNPAGGLGLQKLDRSHGGRGGRLARDGNGRSGNGPDSVTRPGDNGRRGQDREVPDADRVRREFESFCADPVALHAFYLDVLLGMQAATRPSHPGPALTLQGLPSQAQSPSNPSDPA